MCGAGGAGGGRYIDRWVGVRSYLDNMIFLAALFWMDCLCVVVVAGEGGGEVRCCLVELRRVDLS